MRPPYSEELSAPHTTATVTVTVACKIAMRYRSGVPTPKQLMGEFGMSRATAYRWIRAMHDAGYRDRAA